LCWLENPQNYAAIQTLIEHLWAILKLDWNKLFGIFPSKFKNIFQTMSP
jgi:hypothetical protein